MSPADYTVQIATSIFQALVVAYGIYLAGVARVVTGPSEVPKHILTNLVILSEAILHTLVCMIAYVLAEYSSSIVLVAALIVILVLSSYLITFLYCIKSNMGELHPKVIFDSPFSLLIFLLIGLLTTAVILAMSFRYLGNVR